MNSYEEIVSLANQAGIAMVRQDYQAAIAAYASALKIAKNLRRSRLVAVLFYRLGDTLQVKGEIQDAVIAYETALRTLEEGTGSDADSIVDRLSQVGKGFYNNPQPVPDLYRPKVAETLKADEDDPTLAIKLWLNIGNTYLQQPQEGPALNAYEQALKYPEMAANPLLKAYAIANMGEIHRRQGKVDIAETELTEAIQLLDRHGDALEKRRALAFLAGIARDRLQFDEAITLYQQALSLYQKANNALGMGRTYAGLARVYLEQKRYPDAQQTFQQALQLAQAQNDGETLWLSYWGLGCCQHIAGEFKEAIVSFEKSLYLIHERQGALRTDEGKVTFLDSVKDVYDRLLTVHLELAKTGGENYQAALEVAENARGRSLLDLMGGNERRSWLTGLTKLAPGIDVRQSARGSGSNPPDLEAEENQPIRELLPLARLIFYVLLDRTAVFAVTPNGEVYGHVVQVGCHEIEARVALLRRALKVDEATRGLEVRLMVPVPDDPALDVAPINYEILLQKLYAELIAPVADKLPTNGTPLVIEPHEALWLVPFAALQLADGTWMGDRWPLLYAASAQTLDEIRREPCYATLDQSKILVVGNPVMPKVTTQQGYEITLNPLPGSEQEARSIGEFLGVREHKLLIGAEATEASVKTLALNHNILHLATHGFAYTEDPLASFVALSPTQTENGLLTAREVASNALLPADLVVLSACQTGLGRISGDGMLGLSRAFLIAGARTILVSQWSVSDEATAHLMVAFYKHYFSLETPNKAVALQKAMQSLRLHPEYSHPRYWVPFVLVGAEI
ncbi:CHAT domain-containing tetratricopeptide repeat protein [Microcoleus sp. N9_A1]|uniref:CHAT domain-containing tetratricopeptide repeat protein n=1 Tax=Microcoleus sp. N9_A1 TaxID=3055380 RepID=UPI002FD60451